MIRNRLFPVAFAVSVISLFSLELRAQDTDFLEDITRNDPFYYTSDQFVTADDGQSLLVGTGRPSKTHSQIPHLPAYFGYMNTNYTYRFINIVEQTFTMVGEGKHGLWRIQENGTIREYRRQGAQGLPAGADLSASANHSTIVNDYSHFLPEEGFEGYKYPDEQVAEDGRLNFIDLPINHPKYEGKYDSHVPIDLPQFYCTMSEAGFPYAKNALDFAFKQPGANVVGPLGKRAGLDIKELYTNVIRLNFFPDARAWVNVGQGFGDDLQVRWRAIDTSKTNAEFYLVEKPFFNQPYLFLTAVFDNKNNTEFSYVRPDGGYYAHLTSRGVENLDTTVTPSPIFYLEKSNGQTGDRKKGRPIGLPVYGVHHPNRDVYGGGGACPLKGGDWGRYPDTRGASGWPTNYEEVTPLCDAILVDIKFYTNLDGRDWDNPTKNLANAGVGTTQVTYIMQSGQYGVFTDPYHTERGVKNPEAEFIPPDVTLTYPTVKEPVQYVPAE